ncbi:hypothetical protein Rsub_04426 [Raphidocelis subcapitata]|uniref:Gem-associated protein 2 n=1 Tax=Raphidocelis subcapitata TaxID=307507 RepID=A0A2V0NXL2_9CHLO|nr:hypothetical protein Rsub_04426 [Raphidocelis subcapitata]|eukprot:GBF92079.1 hypothetical protein Rsub_04426 [Raphidocelis subcapitata]
MEAGTRQPPPQQPPPYDEEDDDASSGSGGGDEDDLRGYGIYQALPVEGEPDWSTAEAQDAEEYLRRVVRADIDVEALSARDEARRRQREQQQQQQQQQQDQPQEAAGAGGGRQAAPGGGKAARQHHPLSAAGGPQLSAGEALAAAPDWAVPSGGWVRAFVEDFQRLRLRAADAYASGELASSSPLPGPNDHQAWDRLCFGRGGGAAAEPEHPEAGGGDGDGNNAGDGGSGGGAVPGSEITFLSPSILPTLMALEPVGVSAVFNRHVQQLLDCQPPSLPLARAQWLFALAARLEKPLTADAAASFRALLRRCAALRAGVGGADDPALPRLNVLIAVAGAYFGQDEGLVQLVDASELV